MRHAHTTIRGQRAGRIITDRITEDRTMGTHNPTSHPITLAHQAIIEADRIMSDEVNVSMGNGRPKLTRERLRKILPLLNEARKQILEHTKGRD